MRAALVAEGGAGVPEADVLFSALRDITVICSKSREQLKRHHILRCKLSAFAFARTMEALTSSCYFTKRCGNVLFSQDHIYIYVCIFVIYNIYTYNIYNNVQHMKNDHLPRQARDKHKENADKTAPRPHTHLVLADRSTSTSLGCEQHHITFRFRFRFVFSSGLTTRVCAFALM